MVYGKAGVLIARDDAEELAVARAEDALGWDLQQKRQLRGQIRTVFAQPVRQLGLVALLAEAKIGRRAGEENLIKKYSNGKYDKNIDALYDQYIMAKEMYQQNGDQAHRDKLMESVGKLMVEVYDMLSSMVMDSDFAEERKEIQRQIKKLAEM